MAIETIGEAWNHGWRCYNALRLGKDDGMKSIRACIYNMETLVATRGRDFPFSRRETRLRCPRCGSRRVTVLYEPPAMRAWYGPARNLFAPSRLPLIGDGGNRLKKVSEYLRHAEECEALARAARNPEEREMIAQMAETWRGLAEARERKLVKDGHGDHVD